MNNLKQVAKEIKDQRLEELKEKMRLLKPMLEFNNKIRESDFIKFFLPLIKKEVEVNEINVNIFLHNVYMMTGSYTLPLEVWSDDLKEKLFTLPPIFMDIDDDNPLVTNISYGKLVNKYKRMSEMDSKIGDEFLDKAVRKLGDLLKPSKEEEAYYIKEIYKMYKRYGIINEESQQNKKDIIKTKELEVLDNGDEIFDYD